MTTTNRIPPPARHDGRPTSNSMRRAWIAWAMIPVGLIAAFIVGEGLYALLGYEPEDASEPGWVALVAGLPAIAVFLVPCVAAVLYGNRARVEGQRAGLVPLVTGAVLGVWMLLVNVVSFLAR